MNRIMATMNIWLIFFFKKKGIILLIDLLHLDALMKLNQFYLIHYKSTEAMKWRYDSS